MKCIGWNLAERGKALQAGCKCALAFHPSVNEWNNHREVQLEIKDFAIESGSGAPASRPALAGAIPSA